MRRALPLIVLATLVVPAHALDWDPTLGKLCTIVDPSSPEPCGDSPRPDQAVFTDMATEYGMALGPRLMAPAETLGINGFAFGLVLGLTNVDQDAEHWQRATRENQGTQPSGESPSTLQTLMIDLRKGLPFSVELGGHAGWLVNTELLVFGASVKWAFNEGVAQFPVDLAVRGSVNRVVGSPELELTMAGLDVIASHDFGVARTVNIAPYMAYSPLFIFAASGVIDASPGDSRTPAGTFVFADEDITVHRFVVGSRFIFGSMNFTPEIALAKGIQSYNFNLGLAF